MKKILTIALVSAACLTSCDDWLNLEPENAVTAEKYWRTKQDVSNALTGIYCDWMGASSFIWEQSEMRADMVVPGTSTLSDYTLIREGNITSSNGLVAWAKYYHIINSCNLLLERSAIALANDPAYTVRQDNIYKAQARVIRDLMYFYLIRLYKDVPYVTTANYDDKSDREPAASKQMDILNKLIADLEEVQKDNFLPYSYSSASTGAAKNKGQVTMYMLKALLADMYRMKGSYADDLQESQEAYRKCLDLCNTLIESGQFALIPYEKSEAKGNVDDMSDAVTHGDSCFYILNDNDPDNWFDQLYVAGNCNESIMELQEGVYNSAGFWGLVASPNYFRPNVDYMNNSLFVPTNKELASLYRYRDMRSKINLGAGGALIWKFLGVNLNDVAASVADFKKNVMVYRLAEIYLMKAEVLTQIAMANGNNPEMLLEAYRAVFKVRDRASAVESTDIQLSSGDYMQDRYWDELRNNQPIAIKAGDISASQLEKLILAEEAREMAFEGRRWFDLLRNAERNQEGKGSCTGGDVAYLISIAGSCTSTDKIPYIMGQLRKPDFRYLPYPYNDVSLNKNLSQKPFWGIE